MKRIIAFLLALMLLASLCGCQAKILSTESEIVEAVVVKTSFNSRAAGGYYITVAYGEASNTWQNQELYEYYRNRLGETITCYYITQTYDGGKTSHKLVYNEDLWHPIPEDDPVRLENYTIPEGVE